MDGILQFLETIANVLGTIGNLAVTLVTNIFNVADMLTKFLITLPALFVWLPGTVITIILTLFTIAVVMRILGR